MERIDQIKQRLANSSDGPWSQGRLLLTSQTKRWPEHVRAEADANEKLRVFSWFSALDEGRGRNFICEAREPGDAEFIANAKQDISFLLDQNHNLEEKVNKLSQREQNYKDKIEQLEKELDDNRWPQCLSKKSIRDIVSSWVTSRKWKWN